MYRLATKRSKVFISSCQPPATNRQLRPKNNITTNDFSLVLGFERNLAVLKNAELVTGDAF